MSDLIKKLQAITDESDECYTTDLCHEAADALEAMQKEIEKLNETLGRANRLVKQRDQRIAELESALREIAKQHIGSNAAIAKQALKGAG